MYKVRKVRNKDCYKVTNIETGQVMANCSSREKAYAQVRLLEQIDEEKKEPVKIHTLSEEEQLETKDNTKKVIKKKKLSE
jgi:16S rRNA U1498 N3-methylase RsmE